MFLLCHSASISVLLGSVFFPAEKCCKNAQFEGRIAKLIPGLCWLLLLISMSIEPSLRLNQACMMSREQSWELNPCNFQSFGSGMGGREIQIFFLIRACDASHNQQFSTTCLCTPICRKKAVLIFLPCCIWTRNTSQPFF